MAPDPNKDRVELSAGKLDRIVTAGAYELLCLDLQCRVCRVGRDVATCDDIEDVGAVVHIDRRETRPLGGAQGNCLVVVVATRAVRGGQIFDIGDCTDRKINVNAVAGRRQNDRIGTGTAIDRFSGYKTTSRDVYRIIAAPSSDCVSAGSARDRIAVGATRNNEAFGLAAQRYGHAGSGASGRDRLDALDGCVCHAERIEARGSGGEIDRIAHAATEIDRGARPNKDRVELSAGKLDRIVTARAYGLLVSTSSSVGFVVSAEMSPLATTLRTSVPSFISIDERPAHWVALKVIVWS